MILDAARAAFRGIGLADLEPGTPADVASPGDGLDYWLVPGLRGGDVVAVARVLPDGRVATVGALRQPAADAAQAVTGLGAGEARALAARLRDDHPAVDEPVLVHDGPVGREAWLYAATTADGGSRWIFATGGGTYEREAGAPL